MDVLLDGYNVIDFTARQATPEECALLNAQVFDINWGVFWNGELVALFQAEDDGDGWLRVHATVARKRLHPKVTYLYAKSFSDQLLTLGAVGLLAEIDLKNKAAIRVAREAGFVEQSRNDEWVILIKVPTKE